MTPIRDLTSLTRRLSWRRAARTIRQVAVARTRRRTAGLVLALALAAAGGWDALTAQSKGPKSYVDVSPQEATLQVGEQVQLRSAVLNPVGFELPNRKMTWSSSNPAVASVSDTGLVTAQAAGLVTIVAKSGAALGTAEIMVNGVVAPPPNTAPTVTISEPADGAAFTQGDTITFTGMADDEQDGNLSAAIVWTVAWANDPEGSQFSLGTGASVSSSSLAPGSYLVTGGVADSGGLASVAQVGITVNAACSIVVNLLPSSGLKLPQLLQLSALTSYDTCGRPLEYYWSCWMGDSAIADECPAFLAAANTPDHDNPIPLILLREDEEFVIGLRLCVAGTTECSPPTRADWFPGATVIQHYMGARVSW